MKETGIIMSGNHPKLILDGIKTQTRRIVTPSTSIVGEGKVDWSKFDWEQKTEYDFGGSRYSTESEFVPDELKGQLIGVKKAPPVSVDDSFGLHYLHVPFNWAENGTIFRVYPRYEVGDRLWVRETWAAPFGYDALSPSGLWDKPKICYYADGEPPKNYGIKRPSLFMPRWASRITLEITEVRVERVQDISLEDVYAEGVRNPVFHKGSIGSDYSVLNVMFPELWDSLNAKRGYGWEVNPWVWVISFKLVLSG